MDSHFEFVRSLPSEEYQLLVIRQILYEGSWDEMEKDLLARRSGKPFVFKLQSRIDEDLDRIERLKAYESQNNVSLDEYIEAVSVEDEGADNDSVEDENLEDGRS